MKIKLFYFLFIFIHLYKLYGIDFEAFYLFNENIFRKKNPLNGSNYNPIQYIVYNMDAEDNKPISNIQNVGEVPSTIHFNNPITDKISAAESDDGVLSPLENVELTFFDPLNVVYYSSKNVAASIDRASGFVSGALYLNYPNRIKSASGYKVPRTSRNGFVILQSDDNKLEKILTINNDPRKSVPYAYILSDNNQWCFGIPKVAIKGKNFSIDVIKLFYNNSNLYFGKDIGFKKDQPTDEKYNFVVGNNLFKPVINKPFCNDYNSIVGCSNYLNVSAGYTNNIFGYQNLYLMNLTNPFEFNGIYNFDQDYRAYLKKELFLSTGNIITGNNNFNFSTQLIAQPLNVFNAHNCIYGNYIFLDAVNTLRNIIIGNLIFGANLNKGLKTEAFYDIENNIILGNNLFYTMNNQRLSSLKDNIIIIPDGVKTDEYNTIASKYFNINNQIFQTDTITNNTKGCIFLGIIGGKEKVLRENLTYIANVYETVFEETEAFEGFVGLEEGSLGAFSAPHVVWSTDVNILGWYPVTEFDLPGTGSNPGNLSCEELDAAVQEMYALPIQGRRSVNVKPQDDNIWLFGINKTDFFSGINTNIPQIPIAYVNYFDHLVGYAIYQPNSDKTAINMIGYEFSYLIPLLIYGQRKISEYLNLTELNNKKMFKLLKLLIENSNINLDDENKLLMNNLEMQYLN